MVKRTNSLVSVMLLIGLLQAACSQAPIVRSPDTTSTIGSPASENGDRSLLAGEWEYEDGSTAYVIKFDEEGKGTYVWKDGRFETRSLSDHSWNGMWFQRDNDREGGFEVTLSPDYSEGEGRWWYTRIGSDPKPSQKGGTFHLTKMSNHARRDETPPAP